MDIAETCPDGNPDFSQGWRVMNPITNTITPPAGAYDPERNSRFGGTDFVPFVTKREGPFFKDVSERSPTRRTAQPVEERAARRGTPSASHSVSSVWADRDVRFHIEFRSETGDLVLEVRNHETGEVIRQIPPEALLHLGRRLEDLRGILLNEQA